MKFIVIICIFYLFYTILCIGDIYEFCPTDYIDLDLKDVNCFEDIPNEQCDFICQIEVPLHRQASFGTVNTLEDLGITDRGDGGFGSTAKK